MVLQHSPDRSGNTFLHLAGRLHRRIAGYRSSFIIRVLNAPQKSIFNVNRFPQLFGALPDDL
jgi:hypothetical protein